VSESHGLGRICTHCGSSHTRRLGDCSVCNRVVCEHCGNVQYSGGERKIVHHECLKEHGKGLKMIRFVQ
jgi:hypothetical protein